MSSYYKYVRRRRDRWQARPYFHLGSRNGTHVNLGLYKSEWEAWRAVCEYVRTGKRPAHLLPKFVRRVGAPGRAHEGKFVGRVTLKEHGTIVTGPCASPESADRAMRALLRRRFGKDAIERFYPLE